MKQVRGIIFDCDGVLFESRSANLAYYNRILAAFGYPSVTADQAERAHLCHTASSPVVLAELLEPDHVEPALEFAAQLDYREFLSFMTPEPSLTEMLEALATELPLAVATNRGKSIHAILKHFALDGYFQAVVSSHDVCRPKPEPDMLLLAANRLQLAPELCLFVGDSELDQQAAERAGVPFACYGSAIPAAWRLESHRQLLNWIGRSSGA
ncbi:MAG: HAD-IA family hydrolase [Desulfuromonadales bacterium]|nr:HAD-IA family hydrolase [Desulfuromonadales bacterium]